jgi:copper transport protein
MTAATAWAGRVVAVALLAALAVVCGPAPPASAHATLIGTDPVEGAVLDAAPGRVVFTFDEAVAAVPDGVRVFDAAGGAVASTAVVTGTELEVRPTGPVGDGTLVVVWRVVSADGHPISGSLSFSVGAPSPQVVAPAGGAAVAAPAPWALSLARGVGYTGLLLAAGLVVLAVLVVAGAPPADRARRRLVATARAGAAVVAAAWPVGLLLTASYQLGDGASLAVTERTWATLSAAEYGVTAAVVVGIAVAVGLLGDGRPTRPRGRAALVAAGVALGAPALTGHSRAVTPEALAVGADVLHLVAGGVWFGGLVGLALVLPGLSGRGPAAAEVVARFSAVAAGVLAALVATGAVLAWRIVGSWTALVGTGYGRLLLLKAAVAAVAVAVAAWNRYALVPRVRAARRAEDRRAGARVVARSVAAEAGVLAAVVLVTGVLVDTSPASAVPVVLAADADPAGVETATLGDVVVRAELSPRTTGPTTVTVRLEHPSGGPAEGVQSLQARLSSDGVDLGAVPLVFVAEGEYAAEVVVPVPGVWRLQVSVRRSEFVNPVTTLEFDVGGG